MRTFFFIAFRERKGEKNIDVREEHCLAASCTHPDWGPNQKPRCVL